VWADSIASDSAPQLSVFVIVKGSLSTMNELEETDDKKVLSASKQMMGEESWLSP
jgi:hypothetical protein